MGEVGVEVAFFLLVDDYELNSNRLVCVYNFFFIICSVLASWFRLKYPHVALGALASSAPILYFDDITPQNGYYSIVTKDFRVRNRLMNIFSLLFFFLFILMKINVVTPGCRRKLARLATKLYESHGLKSIKLHLSEMVFQSLAKNSRLASTY